MSLLNKLYSSEYSKFIPRYLLRKLQKNTIIIILSLAIKIFSKKTTKK